MKKQSGITLVALVITIIILIILSAVTMSALLSENGLITKAREGVARYGEKQNEEENFFKSFNIDNLQTTGEETEPEVIDPNRRAFKVITTVDGIQYEEGKTGYTFDVYLNNSSIAYKTNVTTFSETLDVGTIVTIKTNPTPECAKSQSQTEVVAGAGNEVVNAIWKSGTFRYYKIKITKLRGIPDSKAIQLSEWNLYDRSQNKFTYPTGTTITATLNGGSSGSGIENIIDNIYKYNFFLTSHYIKYFIGLLYEKISFYYFMYKNPKPRKFSFNILNYAIKNYSIEKESDIKNYYLMQNYGYILDLFKIPFLYKSS